MRGAITFCDLWRFGVAGRKISRSRFLQTIESCGLPSRLRVAADLKDLASSSPSVSGLSQPL